MVSSVSTPYSVGHSVGYSVDASLPVIRTMYSVHTPSPLKRLRCRALKRWVQLARSGANSFFFSFFWYPTYAAPPRWHKDGRQIDWRRSERLGSDTPRTCTQTHISVNTCCGGHGRRGGEGEEALPNLCGFRADRFGPFSLSLSLLSMLVW